MAYAEKRGKGPKPWRVKYKIPGGEVSESGFETKQAALDWGRDQEANVRAGTWMDPSGGEITVNEWISRWQATQDVGLSTMANREYRLRRFIRPYWGNRKLNSLTSEEITAWEQKLPAEQGVSRSTASDARGLLHTILGDAAAAKPPLIPFNPAVRPRNRGRRTGRRLDRAPQRVWATPLEVLLVAERAALLDERDDEFTRQITIAYTGMRWGELTGLERDLLFPAHINVEWQLREISGQFYRLPPKDDSYRSTNVEPLLPVDIPPFLSELLTVQAKKYAERQCGCVENHGGSGRYVFLGPDGIHHYRRSNYSRRVFRPACDGRYQSANKKPGNLVIVDATTWPGEPVAAWPASVSGENFAPPTGRGTQRLVSTQTIGICRECRRAVRRLLDGTLVSHKVGVGHCPGSAEEPADDPPLATWLPVKAGLTPHGYRHSQKTWMTEDGIPEVLAEQRLGHQVPGMRGWYAHVSRRMRDELLTALQVRWEESLMQRAAINPRSSLPLLDGLLAPYREGTSPATVHPIRAHHAKTDRAEMISQISPSTTKAPIRRIG
jgi:integrase